MEYKKTKLIVFLLALTIVGLGWFFIFSKKNVVEIKSSGFNEATSTLVANNIAVVKKNTDIEPQKQLENPPQIIKATYMTSWSAGTESRIEYFLNLKKTTGINAVVIDIKDFSGLVAYDIDLPEIEKYKAKEIRIKNINGLIKRLHEQGVYLIARLTVFQDPTLAKARPDLAVKKKSPTEATSTQPYPTWYDKKGLAWTDPSAKEVWDYNIAIAKDAANRGFDEINFDYIRFPSDGDMSSMYFSFWDKKYPKTEILRNFYSYLRESLPNVKISADIFGLVAIEKEDAGVGQILENVYKYFDFVSPMAYPSHYYSGTLGYKNPADHPYEIVKYTLDKAVSRLINLEKLATNSSSTAASAATAKINSKLRPWLQDFDLGAIYTPEMVKAQIQATIDSLGDKYNGFMVWNPSNIYTKTAL